MKERNLVERSTASSRTNARTILAGALMAAATSAQAFDIDTGNADFRARWDNTLRYNIGQRLRGSDGLTNRANGFSFDQSNALFGKGDVITNRLDLLSELDLSYKGAVGARVSGTAWYDTAYGNFAAHTANPTAYVDDRFTSNVTRYYAGPSAELLDAYLYGRFELGDRPIDARLGRHAVIWGEGLFGSTNSVAYAQGPSDARKLTANPGASAKETALPVNQVSAVAQVNDKLVLSGLYTFQWASNRIPEGGTYFALADTILEGPNVGRSPALVGRGGDIGLSARWRPDFLGEGTVGIYYRKFDEKTPWAAQLDPSTGLRRAVYAHNVDTVGVSLSKVVGGTSLSSEVSYRLGMPLNSRGQAAGTLEGARGDTLHALLNATTTFGNTPIFDSAALAGELAYTRLIKVTRNAQLYRGNGNAATGCAKEDIVAGCSTKDFASAALSFTPSWTQVWPSVDMSLPIFYSINFKGNAATNSGGSEGFQIFKVGVSFVAYTKHFIDLAATFYHGKSDSQRGLVLGAPYNDKAFISLTYQTSF